MLICRCTLTRAAVAAASRNVGVAFEWSLREDTTPARLSKPEQPPSTRPPHGDFPIRSARQLAYSTPVANNEGFEERSRNNGPMFLRRSRAVANHGPTNRTDFPRLAERASRTNGNCLWNPQPPSVSVRAPAPWHAGRPNGLQPSWKDLAFR